VFLNLTMLAGLAGALVPLLVHLLSRARYQTVDWGAMMFLEGVDARERASTRLKQWVILLLRMGIIACLAMALAQPVLRGRWGGGGNSGDGRICAVIVLDTSSSVALNENGKTRMEQARAAVLSILESLKENRAAVVLMGTRDPEMLGPPTTDLQQLAQKVIALGEPSGQADVALGLSKAADTLNQAPETMRELYVVCDQQASSWVTVTEGFARATRSRLAKPGTQTRFFVVPLGSAQAENLAVESVELVNPPAIRDQTAEVEVRVHNYGKNYRGGIEVKVQDASATISVGPGQTGAVRVPLKFREIGPKLITASLSGGGLRFDDQMKAAIDVIDPIRVLIVSGDERAAALQSESDFLRIALAPKAAEARQRGDNDPDKRRSDPCRVDVQTIDRWDEDDLRKYQVLILANVPQLTLAQTVAVEQFVYEGGGLWIAPGGLTRADSLNTMLYRGGAGVMPARLLAPTAEDGADATNIQGISEFDHSVFRFLKGRPDPVPAATIGRYFPAEPRTRGARVLAHYGSGQPFLIEAKEGTAGRGRVLLMTTPIDTDWGTLPLSSFYLPFAQSAVRYLAAGQIPQRNLAPGEPIVERFGPDVEIIDADPTRPAPTEPRDVPEHHGIGGTRSRSLTWTRNEVRYTDTAQPGTYMLRVAARDPATLPEWARHGIPFVVQASRLESDLRSLEPEQWTQFADWLGFQRIAPAGDRSIAREVASARKGNELWFPLIAIVIAMGVIELAVVRRWSPEGTA
jgi:hypothetical protein